VGAGPAGAALDALPQARVEQIEIYPGQRRVLTLDLAALPELPAGPRWSRDRALPVYAFARACVASRWVRST
jgi:hypothetical protein